MSIGVLVMAYGGPASLDEIPGYLADIRHGRPTPRAVLDEITENYRAIGGSSPLLAVSQRQVDALAAELGDEYRCYLGMRHWAPWIEDVVGEMVDDGVDARGEPRPRAALQRALGRALPAEGRRRARALSRADRLRARRELPRRARVSSRRSRRAWRRGSRAGRRRSASACTSSSARTAFRSASSRRAIPTASSASRPRGSSPSAPGCRTIAGRGRTSRQAARPSRGRGRISASISPRWQPTACAT